MIRLKKYLNPHEKSCSKVMSILITGNILHETSSAPQQHKSVQYKWFSLYLHRDVSHTDMLQPHFISCRGVSGAGGNMRGSRNFRQFYLVLSLFYSLQRGPMVLLQRKLYLYEGCSNMNASSFITFFIHMLRQNVIPFWKELFVAFKMAPNIKKLSLYFSSYGRLYKGHSCILEFF